jgi:transcription-repair coupling factor (superfamily II helicase)
MPLFQLPAPGQRTSTALLHGSSDAPALAALAARARPLLVLTESAWQAQRLLQEIPFFAPQLRVHMLPDWETLPYDHFSPHHDLVSERLATLCQMVRGDFDIALVPRHHGAVPHGAGGLHHRQHLLFQAGRQTRRRSAAPSIDAGRLQPCHPGRRAR